MTLSEKDLHERFQFFLKCDPMRGPSWAMTMAECEQALEQRSDIRFTWALEAPDFTWTGMRTLGQQMRQAYGMGDLRCYTVTLEILEADGKWQVAQRKRGITTWKDEPDAERLVEARLAFDQGVHMQMYEGQGTYAAR